MRFAQDIILHSVRVRFASDVSLKKIKRNSFSPKPTTGSCGGTIITTLRIFVDRKKPRTMTVACVPASPHAVWFRENRFLSLGVITIRIIKSYYDTNQAKRKKRLPPQSQPDVIILMGLFFSFFFFFPDNADNGRSRDGEKKKLLTINRIDKRGFFFINISFLKL